MTIELPELPFDKKSLEPYMSEKTVSYHYEKHHAGYLKNLISLIKDTSYEKLDLIKIIKSSHETKSDISIFNNASQVYNHNLFWNSISPNKEDRNPSPKLKEIIERDIGSIEECIARLSQLAISRFGSGWSWLCLNPEDKMLRLTSTQNAENPLTDGLIPLLTLDVWEHSYYLDYQNLRGEYVESFFKNLVNFQYASQQLEMHL